MQDVVRAARQERGGREHAVAKHRRGSHKAPERAAARRSQNHRGLVRVVQEEFLKIGKVRHDTIAKYERNAKLTADEPHTVYGIPASEVTKEEGPYVEDSRMIMDSLRKEMLMYNDGIQDLLQQLPVRSAAQLYLSAFPSAPDPLSLALELKKKLRPESKADVW